MGHMTTAPANVAKHLPDEATCFVWLFCEARGIGRRQYMDEPGFAQEDFSYPQTQRRGGRGHFSSVIKTASRVTLPRAMAICLSITRIREVTDNFGVEVGHLRGRRAIQRLPPEVRNVASSISVNDRARVGGPTPAFNGHGTIDGLTGVRSGKLVMTI